MDEAKTLFCLETGECIPSDAYSRRGHYITCCWGNCSTQSSDEDRSEDQEKQANTDISQCCDEAKASHEENRREPDGARPGRTWTAQDEQLSLHHVSARKDSSKRVEEPINSGESAMSGASREYGREIYANFGLGRI